MPCTKSKFPSKRAVNTKVNTLVKAGHWNKKDKTNRVYYCDECASWHMTSLAEFNPTVKPLDVVVMFKERWNNLFKKN